MLAVQAAGAALELKVIGNVLSSEMFCRTMTGEILYVELATDSPFGTHIKMKDAPLIEADDTSGTCVCISCEPT